MMVLKFVEYGLRGFITSAVFVLCWVIFAMLLGLLIRLFDGNPPEENDEDE